MQSARETNPSALIRSDPGVLTVPLTVAIPTAGELEGMAYGELVLD